MQLAYATRPNSPLSIRVGDPIPHCLRFLRSTQISEHGLPQNLPILCNWHMQLAKLALAKLHTGRICWLCSISTIRIKILHGRNSNFSMAIRINLIILWQTKYHAV